MQVLSNIFNWVILSSLMAGILICIILLVKQIFKNKLSPGWHYYIWLLLLIRLILPYAPESPISIYNILDTLKGAVMINNGADPSPVQNGTNDPKVLGDEGAMPGTAEAVVRDANSESPHLTKGADAPDQLPGILYFYYIWLAGMLLLAIYTGVSNIRLFRIVRRHNSSEDLRIIKVLNECRAEMKINYPVFAAVTVSIHTPCIFGLFRPRLLIPDDIMKRISDEELRFIILHELVHLKRKDTIINWIAVLVMIIHWFNPLVWYGIHRMRQDCEISCDAKVLSLIKREEHLGYGNTIIRLAGLICRNGFVPGTTGILSGKFNIKRRITMISKFGKRSFIWIVLALLLFAVIGASCLTNANRNTSADVPPANVSESGPAVQDVKTSGTEVNSEEVNNEVETLLADIIENGPKASSNPYDYVKDSEAFQKLAQLGQPAVDYMFESFSKGNEDGLREYVMACACAKIMGIYDEERGIGTNSGREWFYKYGKFEAMDNFLQVDADYLRYAKNGNEKGDKVVLPDDVDKHNMEDVVSNYILAVNRNGYLMGEKAVESHKILGSEEKSGVIYLYLQIGFGWYGFENGIFTTVSGGGDTARMQLVRSSTGEYEVTEYKRAMDGGMWEKSIRDMFPKDLADKVIKNRNGDTGNELSDIQFDKASAYLKEIGREDAPIQSNVKKNMEDKGVTNAVYLASLMRRDFPDWVGTKELLFITGGPAPGSIVRCVFETGCEPAQDGGYTVTLTKTWDITVNGRQPVSAWKYKVSGDKIELVDSVDNDGMIRTIK